MSQCRQCFLDLRQYPPASDGRCPNCGFASGEKVDTPPQTAPLGPGATYVLFNRFWSSVRDVIFRPTAFFARQADMITSNEGLSAALAFAVIIQWLASFFNFIWRSTAGVLLQNRLDDLFRIAGDVIQAGPGATESMDELRARAIEFMFGAGAIVLTPFTTLIKLSIIALFVHAAVRFFMKETEGRPHSYSATMKILAYATGPWILCIIPGFGMLLGWILAFSAAVIGIREVYRTTTTRALLAVAFPELLFVTFVFGIAVFFLFLAFNVFRIFW